MFAVLVVDRAGNRLAFSIRQLSIRASHPSPIRRSLISNLKDGVVNALRALRRGEVLRWLTLLQFSDLMLDVLLGFLALYFVDVVGVTPAQAGLAVAVWTGVGLLGDFLLIPLLERVRGLSYLARERGDRVGVVHHVPARAESSRSSSCCWD